MIIREPYNEMVRNGTKTILLNPGKPKYKNLPMGSNIFLFGNNGPCIVRVNERKIYTSFRAALEDNDIQKILPGIANLQAAVDFFEATSLQSLVSEYGVVSLNITAVPLALK